MVKPWFLNGLHEACVWEDLDMTCCSGKRWGRLFVDRTMDLVATGQKWGADGLRFKDDAACVQGSTSIEGFAQWTFGYASCKGISSKELLKVNKKMIQDVLEDAIALRHNLSRERKGWEGEWQDWQGAKQRFEGGMAGLGIGKEGLAGGGGGWPARAGGKDGWGDGTAGLGMVGDWHRSNEWLRMVCVVDFG